MSQAASALVPQTSAPFAPPHARAASPKRVSPLMFLPGLAFWGFVGTGIYLENETLIGVGVAMLVLVIATKITLGLRRAQAERAELLRIWHEGLPATAKVLAISANGGMNDHPRVTFQLEVSASGRAPYPVETTVIVSQLAIPRIQPGCELAVRVDPRDGSRVVVDESVTYLGYR